MAPQLKSQLKAFTFVFHLRVFLILVLLSSTSLYLAGSSAASSLQASGNLDQTGIELYEKGDFREAVKIFKAVVKQDKNYVLGWHYLGLAFEGIGKKSDARKAHDKAAKTGQALLTSQLGKAHGPEYLNSLRPLVYSSAMLPPAQSSICS